MAGTPAGRGNMNSEFFMHRIVVGMAVVAFVSLVSMVASAVTFPLIKIFAALALFFYVGDWAVYLYENKKAIVVRALEALK